MDNIKFVIVGDERVGKTSFFHKHVFNTIQFDFIPQTIRGYSETREFNELKYNIGFCDTCSDKASSKFRPLSYPQTDVVGILFSISDSESFENCYKNWYPEIKSFIPNVPIILIGTKSDLYDNFRYDQKYLIKSEQGIEMANKINAVQYIETSSLSGKNISKVFDLVYSIYVSNKAHSAHNNDRNRNDNCKLN